MADLVNEYGMRVWKDSKGVWRKIGDDGKRTSQFASAPLLTPKDETHAPKPASEVHLAPSSPHIVPEKKNPVRRALPTVFGGVMVLVGFAVLYLLWPQIKSFVADSSQQTVEQSAPTAPTSEPEKVASGSQRDSRCNLDGTVFVNQLGRCVFPPK